MQQQHNRLKQRTARKPRRLGCATQCHVRRTRSPHAACFGSNGISGRLAGWGRALFNDPHVPPRGHIRRVYNANGKKFHMATAGKSGEDRWRSSAGLASREAAGALKLETRKAPSPAMPIWIATRSPGTWRQIHRIAPRNLYQPPSSKRTRAIAWLLYPFGPAIRHDRGTSGRPRLPPNPLWPTKHKAMAPYRTAPLARVATSTDARRNERRPACE